MTYLPTMGAVDAANFNDTRFPGIAYATNPETHALFTDMQKQLNRAAYARKLSTRIATDGKIGSDTLAIAKAVGPVLVDYSSVRNLAMMADVVRDGAKAASDAAGAPANVSSPIPSSPPKIITPSGSLVKAPPVAGASLIDSVKNLGMPTLLVIGILGLGAGYYLTKGKLPFANPAKLKAGQYGPVYRRPKKKKPRKSYARTLRRRHLSRRRRMHKGR